MQATGEHAGARGPARWGWADAGWILAIGLAALATRLGFALQFADHPLGRLPWVDEGAYWERAREILAGRWLPPRPFYQDPLFPYALSLLMRALGTEVATLRVALAGLGALTPVILFLAGRRGLGRAEGVVAGGIAALYGPMIFTDGLLEKEGLAALVASLALLASAGAASGAGIARFGLAGWAWGLLALLRANALLVGPLGGAWAAAWARGRRRWIAGLAFAGGFALAILPATAINAYVGRPAELILTTSQSGANFYIGNGPGATGTYRAPDFVEANPAREAGDFEAEAWRRTGRPLSPAAVSRFWLGEGLARWRDAPGESARLLAAKLGLLLHDFEIPDNQDIEFARLVAAPRLAWGFLTFGWLAPAAALGLGLARRDRSPFWWLLATTSAVGLLSTAAFFVMGRYRIPWTPGLTLLAAAGLVDLARRARAGRWSEVGRLAALLALPAAALAWRPIADPTPDRWGHELIMLAVAELGESRLDPAIDALDDARALSPGAAARVAEVAAAGPVHDRLADLIQRQLGADGAAPGASKVRRARWLRQVPEGRPEARALLDAALGDDPGDRAAARESAAWFLGEPDDPEARRRAAGVLDSARLGPGGDVGAAVLLALLERRADLLPRPGPATAPPLRRRASLAGVILGRGRFN